MEIGNEISQKIRSAIKAKLVELGAYVDEELPDYIMVMVANKKSLIQMTEDLSLFLGANTDRFTTWLHGLLVKLQSLTSDPISVPAKGESSKAKDQSSSAPGCEVKTSKRDSSTSTVDVGTTKKRKSGNAESDGESKKIKSEPEKVQSVSVTEPNPVSQAPGEAVVVEEFVAASKKVTLEPEPSSENAAKPQPVKAAAVVSEAPKDPAPVIQVVEEDDLSELLLTENDELTEELEQETAVIAPAKKAEPQTTSGDSEAKPIKETTSVTITLPNLLSSHASGTKPKAVASPVRPTTHRTASVRPVEARTTELFTRKRRGPVSVVASVSRDDDDDDDTGYDPYNPAVGSVASVIKVTARKSSVPPKLQANKSLLLKAMSEAEKSVETQRRVAITPIRPFMRSDRKERERDEERPSRSSRSTVKENHPSSRLARSSIHQVISQTKHTRKSDSPPVYIPTRKVHPAPRSDAGIKVGIVSKSRREEAERLAKREINAPINFVVKRQREKEPEVIEDEPIPGKVTPVQEVKGTQAREVQSGTEIDSRIVEYEAESMATSVEEEKSTESGSQGIPEILDDMQPDEFVLDPDLETAESSGLYEEDRRLVDMKEKQKDKTRFVVTLDGVDEEEYEMSVLASQEEAMEIQPGVLAMEEEPSSREPVSSSLVRSPPKVQSFSISLKDSDEETEAMQEEPTPLKKAKMMERCKFWPACVNGAACEFHHPTIQCKTFPQCKFGDKCLYIHPNCRFDSKCMRPDCPYTHSSKRMLSAAIIPMYRMPAPPPPPVVPARIKNPPQCKFFPACSNMACPFFHPKPCRFGIGCKNKERSCPFYHPSLPSKDKLKWQAGKAAASGDAATPASTPV